ncbi:MAG: cytochrome c oxidase assembly protein [Flavobacteriaceae bacterium]
MATHIALMNVAAPCAALALRWRAGNRSFAIGTASALVASFLLQLGLLWGWHVPAVFDAAVGSHVLMPAMMLSLAAVSFLYWNEIFAAASNRAWQALASLIVTGKLFCLLGVLLTFSPRPLYAGAGLADQQLAGLLMLLACPATYVAVAIAIAARWFSGLEGKAGWAPGMEP